MGKKFYVTTPIYYPSSTLHLGHAYTTTIADILARYKTNQGYDVFFLTGSDEHGQKIAKKAAEKKMSPQKFVDEIVLEFKDLWEKLQINYTKFIRTTDNDHKVATQKIFSMLLKNGDIYLGDYHGWYCISCEEFLTDNQIYKSENTCKICLQPLNYLAETSYFFKMKKYIKRLLDYYEANPFFIWPLIRKTEMISNFIKPGLSDLSVTRTTFDWGISVLEDPKHVIYVWIDALSNYITALGYLQQNDNNFQQFWVDPQTEIVQVVGKEITRFHAIYWPIMLMALNLRLPHQILAHGWIVNEAGKMSKSKGNVIDPRILIVRYSADAVRCFLMKEINIGSDGKYNHELFCNFYNAFLVNDLGNLLSRVMTMITKYAGSVVPVFQKEFATKAMHEMIDNFTATIDNYYKLMNNYQISSAVDEVWQLIAKLNKFIDVLKPWVLFKTEQYQLINNGLNILANSLLIVSVLLAPILIDSAKEIQNQLGLKKVMVNISVNFDLNFIAGNKINKAKLLFKRLNIDEELNYLNSI